MASPVKPPDLFTYAAARQPSPKSTPEPFDFERDGDRTVTVPRELESVPEWLLFWIDE